MSYIKPKSLDIDRLNSEIQDNSIFLMYNIDVDDDYTEPMSEEMWIEVQEIIVSNVEEFNGRGELIEYYSVKTSDGNMGYFSADEAIKWLTVFRVDEEAF